MAAYPRYRFETSFGAPAATAEPEPAALLDPLDEPRHSDRDLEAALAEARREARDEALAEGRLEGERSAGERIDARAAASLGELAERLDRLDAEHAAAMDRLEALGTTVLLALVRRLAPRLLDGTARGEVGRLAVEALQAAGSAPLLTLRVHPTLHAALEARLAGSASGPTSGVTRLEIVDDPALAIGALEARWGDGSVRRDPAELETAVAGLVDRAASLLLPDPAPSPVL